MACARWQPGAYSVACPMAAWCLFGGVPGVLPACQPVADVLPAVCNANETVTRYLGKMEAFLNLTKHHIAI